MADTEIKTPINWEGTYRRKYGDMKPKSKAVINEKVSQVTRRLKQKGITDPLEVMAVQLKNDRSIDELMYVTSKSRYEVLGMIEELRIQGYDIVQIRTGDNIAFSINRIASTTYNEFHHHHEVNKTFKIGIVADPHICSKYWQMTLLRQAYQHMKQLGVKNVYNAGDMTDGFYKKRMHEAYLFGADDQAEEVIDKYPCEEGMTTFFILGNHDATHIQNGGANIGKNISGHRKDMIYLGQDFAKIWLTDKVDMDIIHPGDGTAYALSYQLQKRINNMTGGEKPRILVTGHYHKYFTMFYRNIYAISAPAFQAQSPWMRGKAIGSDIGYIVLDININEQGDIVEFVQHYYPFYVPIIEKYR